jgi:heme/copper-type cytochrome/quinol oxidase subunit 2
MNLMKDPAYLEVNPLRLMSFWLVTVLLFYFSLTFLTNNSREYLWQKQPLLAESLALIDMVLGISCLVVIVLIIAAPNLKVKLEKEPAHA